MKVLVIGGTLFIGKLLVEELLKEGHEVAVLHRKPKHDFGRRVENLMADRNDAAAMKEVLSGRRYDVVYDNVYDWERGTTAAQVEATGYYTPRGIAALYLDTRRTNQNFVNRGGSGRVVAPQLFGTPVRLTSGIDYQNTPITTGAFGRANTPLASQTLSELDESATTVGPFVLADVALGERVSATAGLRYDHIMFSTENLIRPQDGRSEILYEQFSPRAGITFRLTHDVALYASYNEGFEAPILDQLRNSPARDGISPTGILIAPATWPLAYSRGVRTSTSCMLT